MRSRLLSETGLGYVGETFHHRKHVCVCTCTAIHLQIKQGYREGILCKLQSVKTVLFCARKKMTKGEGEPANEVIKYIA